jgi:hypothetical protein
MEPDPKPDADEVPGLFRSMLSVEEALWRTALRLCALSLMSWSLLLRRTYTSQSRFSLFAAEAAAEWRARSLASDRLRGRDGPRLLYQEFLLSAELLPQESLLLPPPDAFLPLPELLPHESRLFPELFQESRLMEPGASFLLGVVPLSQESLEFCSKDTLRDLLWLLLWE